MTTKMQFYTFCWTLFLVLQKAFSMANERKRVFKFTKLNTMQNVSDTIVQPTISTESTSATSCAALLLQYGPFTCMEYYDLQKTCNSYREGDNVDSLISQMDTRGLFYYTDPLNVTRECKIDDPGRDYRGTKNTTITGIPCMIWSATYPHVPYESIDIYLSAEEGPEILDTNYCRNPDNHPEGPWCYTMDQGTRWQECDIPYCQC